MRLDKLLAALQLGSRSEVKNILKKGQIRVNGEVVKKPETQVDEHSCVITFQEKEYRYVPYFFLILNKPAGYVTATEDQRDLTVMELLPPQFQKLLFPVGRLDKDTEGLLLFTNHGPLSHHLLSPKRHVDKTYQVVCGQTVTENQCRLLSEGVDIGEAEKTLPAKAVLTGEKELLLTIREGKYHQVKRMLEAVGNRVVFLKRLCFGNLTLNGIEKPSELRELNAAEVEALFQLAGLEKDF